MTSQEIVQRTPQQELVAAIRSDESRTQIAAALEGSGIPPSKFVRVALTAINENAQLVDADRASLFGSLMRCAQDGLLPDGREAALVMFGKKATYMPMVGGLRKIAAEYGWAIVAAVVHEADSFDPDFENMRANYKPVRLGMDPGDAQGAYAVGEHKDGRRVLEVMTLQEIEAVRATSRAKNSGPWVEWWGEMARKTVVRRLFKSLPLDPKDRERVERVLAATAEDGVTMLYGEDSPGSAAGGTASAATPRSAEASEAAEPSPDSAASSTDVIDVEGEEVPFEEPPPVADEPRFPTTEYAGKQLPYAGKTLQETFDAGDDGITFLQWAWKNWKSEPLRSALDAFAETHPEIKSND